MNFAGFWSNRKLDGDFMGQGLGIGLSDRGAMLKHMGTLALCNGLLGSVTLQCFVLRSHLQTKQRSLRFEITWHLSTSRTSFITALGWNSLKLTKIPNKLWLGPHGCDVIHWWPAKMNFGCNVHWQLADTSQQVPECFLHDFQFPSVRIWMLKGKPLMWDEDGASPLSRVYSTSKPCSNDTSWLLTSWMARKLSSGIVNMGKSSFSVAHSCCFSGARTASAKRSKAVARPLLLQLDPHRIMATRRLGDGKSQELAICPKRQIQIFVSLHVTCVPGCDVPHVCHRCYA